MKIIFTTLVVIVGVLIFILINPIHKVTCRDFQNQREALAHYTKYLDRDNDLKPCESLPK